MDSLVLFPRDASSTCTGSTQWYVCTAGNFRGCCSSDPCTTGICPDNDDSSSTTSTLSDLSLTTSVAINKLPNVTPRTTTTSSMTTLTEATTISEIPTTTPSASSTASSTGAETTTASETSQAHVSLSSSELSATTDTSTSSGATAATASTALSSVLAVTHGVASPSTTPTSVSNASSPNLGAIIGGVLGGLAVLTLLAILIFCCLRRRRKQTRHGKRSTTISWYPYGSAHKDRIARSEMKEPQSPCDSEANRSNPTSSIASPNSAPGIHLTPDLILTSSSTNLISHSPQKNQVPQIPPLSTEFAQTPHRQGQPFTPELQDTGLQRLRAELASSPRSEWINVPLNQRHQNMRARSGARAWESPTLAPIPASPCESPAREQRQGHTRSCSEDVSVSEGRVVTAEGVVLGANLDRYSNGLEIGNTLEQLRGRSTDRGADHVMSFMQFAGGSERETRGFPVASGGDGGGADGMRVRAEDSILHDDVSDGDGDVPPAYEPKEGSLVPEIKSPSGRMEMSLRGV